MSVRELNSEQLASLKQALLCERFDKNGETPSLGDIAKAEITITNEEVFERYDGIAFSEDDFFA